MAETTRILERGYRRYSGDREGVGHAVRSTVAHTIRHVMGLHRPARYKVLPFFTLLICFLPALVFVGAAAFLPDEAVDFIPGYADYYGYVSRAIVLYVSIVVPDALCGDRRSRSLSLYFSSALSRTSYLAAKFIAVMACLLLATLAPVLLVLIGFVAQGVGPDGVAGFAGTLGRIFASGVLIAFAYACLAMGLSSLTDRRGFATAAVFLTVFFSSALGAMLVDLVDAPQAFYLVDFGRAQAESVRVIFGREQIGLREFTIGDAWWPIVVAQALWIGASAYLCVHRYRTVRVTR